LKLVVEETGKLTEHGAARVVLSLDLKRKKISARRVHEEELADFPEPSVIIPHVDARENYDPVYRFLKRSMDVLFSLAALTILSPLLIIVAVLIKLDSKGPVFYKQERTGKNGRRFMMYKFRTMYRNSDEMKKALAKKSHLKYPDFKMRNDPRVTKIGRILRKFSIDEMPNFINVLKGDMSLVGPRPTSFGPETYTEWHKLRLKATPGLTGLQQVSGRANLQFDERVLLDIQYVLYQSIILDVSILLKTVFVVLTTKGSY